jgi:hypothetical protein
MMSKVQVAPDVTRVQVLYASTVSVRRVHARSESLAFLGGVEKLQYRGMTQIFTTFFCRLIRYCNYSGGVSPIPLPFH